MRLNCRLRVSKMIPMADELPMIRDAFLYGNICVIHRLVAKSLRLVDHFASLRGLFHPLP